MIFGDIVFLVSLTSSDESVGIILGSIQFNGNTNNAYAYFDPTFTGSTTVSLITPEGFSTPIDNSGKPFRQSFDITVNP